MAPRRTEKRKAESEAERTTEDQDNHGGSSTDTASNNQLGAPSASSTRRQREKEIAQARAAHFARADAGDRLRPAAAAAAAAGSSSRAASTPFPTARPSRAALRRAKEAPPPPAAAAEGAEGGGAPAAPAESWPGPWSTARELEENQEAAREARLARLEQGTAEEADDDDEPEKKRVRIAWAGRGRGSVLRAAPVAPLADRCVGLLVAHVGAVESFGAISAEVRTKIFDALCRRRLLTAANLKKLAEPGAEELAVPDCSAVDEEVFLEVLAHCAGPALAAVRLGSCGRVLAPPVARKFMENGSHLKVLSLEGLYRIFDQDLEKLLLCCPNLESLSLDSNECVGDLTMKAISERLPALHSLSLQCCQKLTADQLRPLASLSGRLTQLHLDHTIQLTDDVLAEILAAVGPGLTHLGLSGCERLGDAGVAAVAAHCRGLAHLRLGGLYGVAKPSYELLFGAEVGAGACLALASLSLGGAYAVDDDILDRVARAGAGRLRALELDSVADLTDATILSLSKHCKHSLEHLDISFCRGITDQGLGHLVDHCRMLKEITIWGCTQITDVFLQKHSNPHLLISGGNMRQKTVQM